MFNASSALVALLQAADIDVQDLNAEMCRRSAGPARRMNCVDPVPRTISLASGLGIELIAKRRGALLVEVHHRGLIYRERSMSDCIVLLPGELPEVAKAKAAGLGLDALADLGLAATALAEVGIVAELPAWSGATAFSVLPRWIRFDGGQRPASAASAHGQAADAARSRSMRASS